MDNTVLSISKEKLNQLYTRIASLSTLYLPFKKEGHVQFAAYNPGEYAGAVSLESLNTVRSAKDFFFPQHENLVAFKTRDKSIEIIDNHEKTLPFIVMGIRACDMKSFDVLDRVFLSEPADTYYAERRRQATLITQACVQPEETCFCSNFDIDAASPDGDVATWITPASLYWQPLTEKGNLLTSQLKDLLLPVENMKPLDEVKDQIRQLLAGLPLADLPLSAFNPENFHDIFESTLWHDLSQSCIGCGTCTFICPTCQCYDIRDYDTGKGIHRFRCWDSCMYSDFVQMAHGNPRTSQKERFRQRFMHKLVYTPVNMDGLYGCAGCGRCLAKCPSSMNIVKVIHAFGGEDHV